MESSGRLGKTYSYDSIESMANLIRGKINIKPVIGIICGTGLAGLGDRVEHKEVFSYEDIPDFPVSTVKGHKSKFVFGYIEGKPVMCMLGRFHFYEGYSLSELTVSIRVMSLLGVKTLFVTNASGGVNRDYKVGDMMIIKDHINMPGLAGNNPLTGPNEERFGTRFPAISNAYDHDLRRLAHEVATDLGYASFLREGVYCMVAGPSFESPAEIRFINCVGGDVVGMSTCPEVIVARHCGLRVFGLSLITNKCIMFGEETEDEANHEEVLQIGAKRNTDIQALFEKLISKMD
ncbi:purine nucleoside phosphorylase-like [Anneissia japonica]|uniref:purine nucleoside phosphorylase-like n=1 Tax=Anneissia japonica TaxID=1529436 RepID=UPI001425AB4F|nr:purine nucleoside phosphorylase-like [Anneissia japonica]